MKRITEIKNVAGVVVVNSEGITVKSTLDNVLSVQVKLAIFLILWSMTKSTASLGSETRPSRKCISR